MRPVFEWSLGSRSLQLGKRTLVMGVVNVTPDSFSDGGVHFDRERAVEHGLQMLQDGADIIDVGGESTRPGAKVLAPEIKSEKKTASGQEDSNRHPVSEKEELDRVIPVIAGIKQKQPQAVISVDTYKANVAHAAVEAGAEIVNDVSGFRWDARMPKTLAELQALCPPGSDNNAQMRMVTSYWDMAASFVTAGVLNPELFFVNNRELLVVWLRVRNVVAELRATHNEPGFWKNLETVGDQYSDYLNRTSPGTLQAFTARMGG